MEGSVWEINKLEMPVWESPGELEEPLLTSRPEGRRGGPYSMGPLYGMSFLRVLALAVSSLPACALRVEELVLEAGGDTASIALIIGLMSALRTLTESVASHVFTSWSNEVGRQPALLVSSAAFVVESAIMALTTSPWLLTATYVAGGMLFTGGTVESLCVEDVIKGEDATASAHGRLFASAGAALTLGPVLGGWLALHYGGAATFACAHVIGLMAVAGVGNLPEYISFRRRRILRRVSWDLPESRQEADVPMLQTLWKKPRLRWSCCALALNGMAMAASAAVNVVWMQVALGFDGYELGMFVGCSGGLHLASQALLLPCLLKVTGGRATAIAKMCLVINALKFIGFASAVNRRWMFLTLVLAAPGNCGTPVLVNLCTSQIPEEQRERWTAALSVLNTVASCLGALAGSWMLAEALRGSRPLGMPFLLAAAFYFLAGACVAQAEASFTGRAKTPRASSWSSS